jgi:hypothetical protein
LFPRYQKVILVLRMRGGTRERGKIRFQTWEEKGNSTKIWEMESNIERQKGKCEGPCIPHLRRFYDVIIFP